MATKLIFFVFGAVLLGIYIEETAATGSNNVTIATPTDRTIKGLDKRKCLLYMWNSICDNQNCTVKIETTLSKGDNNKVTATTSSFKPLTKSNKQAVCFYDSCFETDECCEVILSGTKAHAQKTPFGDNYKIDFKMDRERLGQKITVRNTFLLPWKNPCVLKEPCKPYGSCSAENPNDYKCTCTAANWKGKNCSEREGWSVSPNKCLKKATVVQSLASNDVTGCIKGCIDMNSKLRIGCKSFEFTPGSFGNLIGSCKLYAVSKNHGGAELKDCSSWYMDLKDLSAWALSNGAPPCASVFILMILNLGFVAFLHII